MSRMVMAWGRTSRKESREASIASVSMGVPGDSRLVTFPELVRLQGVPSRLRDLGVRSRSCAPMFGARSKIEGGMFGDENLRHRVRALDAVRLGARTLVLGCCSDEPFRRREAFGGRSRIPLGHVFKHAGSGSPLGRFSGGESTPKGRYRGRLAGGSAGELRRGLCPLEGGLAPL